MANGSLTKSVFGNEQADQVWFNTFEKCCIINKNLFLYTDHMLTCFAVFY